MSSVKAERLRVPPPPTHIAITLHLDTNEDIEAVRSGLRGLAHRPGIYFGSEYDLGQAARRLNKEISASIRTL